MDKDGSRNFGLGGPDFGSERTVELFWGQITSHRDDHMFLNLWTPVANGGEILLCSRLKQNPFLPVRRARGSQSQPYYDDGMITLKVLLKSVYTSQKYYLTMTLQRCIHAYVQYHLLSANTWFSMTNLLRIEKDNISEYCLSSSYFATVPRGFGFHETLVLFFRLSYSSDKNPGDCSFVLVFVNYKDLLYCRIQRLETLSTV